MACGFWSNSRKMAVPVDCLGWIGGSISTPLFSPVRSHGSGPSGESCSVTWSSFPCFTFLLSTLCVVLPIWGWKESSPGSSWLQEKAGVILLPPNSRELYAAISVRSCAFHDPLYYQRGNENVWVDLLPKWVLILIYRRSGSQFSNIRWYECYLNDMSHLISPVARKNPKQPFN